MFRSNKKSGQVLIEALIAVGFMTVGFSAVFALLSRSLSLNRSSTDSYTAAYLAAEGIEVVRNIVDANGIQMPKVAWTDGVSDGNYEVQYYSKSLDNDQGRFILYDPASHRYSYSGSVQTPFKRQIKIRLVRNDELQVNSIVSWTGLGGGSRRIDVEDHFMNWRF